MKNKKLAMIGAGGHAKVLMQVLKSRGMDCSAVVSTIKPSDQSYFSGLDWYESDAKFVAANQPERYMVVNGLGSIPGNDIAKLVFEFYKNAKFEFMSVVALTAIIAEDVVLGEGVQIMSGSILQPGVSIGDNTVINTGVIIDHDSNIGADNHIAPGAVLSGGVVTGDRVHIGTGAHIIQNIGIGDDSILGAGVSLVRDLASHEIVIPASIRKKRS